MQQSQEAESLAKVGCKCFTHRTLVHNLREVIVVYGDGSSKYSHAFLQAQRPGHHLQPKVRDQKAIPTMLPSQEVHSSTSSLVSVPRETGANLG